MENIKIKCACGCGGEIMKYNKYGKLRRYIRGHVRGEDHSSWKGDKVGYSAVHEWIKKHKPKQKLCECCNKKPAYDLANISGEYKRDVNDFEWICRSCHMNKDGRINNLKQNNCEVKDVK